MTESIVKQEQNRMIEVSPSRPQYPTRALEAFGIKPGDWRVLVDAIFPSAKTTEAVELALSYCRARNLDIFKKPVHIVPIWNAALGKQVESVWPSISELRSTAMRTNDYAGCDETLFGPDVTREFRGEKNKQAYMAKITYPEWAQKTVYRVVKGVRCPFSAKVRWVETYARAGSRSELPNDMWEKRPYGQLDKCAEAAALRTAFPEEIGSDYAAEEMEGRTLGEVIPVEAKNVTPPSSITEALDRVAAIPDQNPPERGLQPPNPKRGRPATPKVKVEEPAPEPITFVEAEVVPPPTTGVKTKESMWRDLATKLLGPSGPATMMTFVNATIRKPLDSLTDAEEEKLDNFINECAMAAQGEASGSLDF